MIRVNSKTWLCNCEQCRMFRRLEKKGIIPKEPIIYV